MKFLHKVFAFFRKPAAAEEVAKAFEQAYQKNQQDKEMDALLDWVEHDKPYVVPMSEVMKVTMDIDESNIKTPKFNHQLAIRKYKTQKKNWAHWKKGARK